MTFKETSDRFWREGFVVLEDFFETGLMDELQQSILRHYRESRENCLNDEFASRSKCEIVPWFPQREGPCRFDAVENDTRLVELTGAVLGPDWASQYCMVMFSARGTNGQTWHQDSPPETKSRYNLNRLVYTQDITDEIGGQLMIVPGTHAGGALPAGDPGADLDGQVTMRPRKGTLVLLHGHCWHRVLPVRGEYRVSTNFRAAPKGTPDDVTDICVYRNMRYQFSTKRVLEERGAAVT